MAVRIGEERSPHPPKRYGGIVTDSYDGKETPFYVWSPRDRERLDYSKGHPYPYHEGGEFMVRKSTIEVEPSRLAKEKWASLTWLGNHIPNPMPIESSMLILPSPIPDTTMVNMGTKGWDKLKPANRQLELGQFLGELKDFKQMFHSPLKIYDDMGFSSSPEEMLSRLRDTARMARNSGKGYLASAFGTDPFVKDVRAMLDFTSLLQRQLRQLKKDNGRVVRRRGNVSVNTSVTSNTMHGYGYFAPAVGPYWADSGLGERITVERTYTRFWFSGAFRYWIPDLPESPVNFSNLSRILGLNPSPSLAWELTPWSWLADYFGNLGSILSNVSGNAADTLVALYAFTMGTDEYSKKVSVRFRGKSGLTYSTQYTQLSSCKRRTAATPFGFGVNMSGLSPKQLAILTALGLSRS